ncbi:hypothetical protein FA95DRAFT_1573640 [Auriscalpium vulgare]|uniref:Uncharacterized protein n=1 Tax=Auriscalpium vulgare TaxID=40419 RepID=A0ACB8RP72_9AGAM|nr:hypothetical protein FA95DRAFT_1573640 [Auriscalpium vulgare]
MSRGHLSLDELQEVNFDCSEYDDNFDWYKRQWVQMFEHATHVSSVVVTGGPTSYILRALDPSVLTRYSTFAPDIILFPELESLVIYNVHFSESAAKNDSGEEDDDEGVNVSSLVSCLSARQARGNVVRLLRLSAMYQDSC